MPFEITAQNIVTLLLVMGAAAASVGVVAFGNAVRSALCLVAAFFCIAFLYFILNAEFLGIAQIVVYTGAIMVLFLFVVMLLSIGGPDALTETRDLKRLLGVPFGLALCGLVIVQVALPLQKVEAVPAAFPTGRPDAIGKVLLTHYFWPFEVASILLLIGIVGSILLAKRKI